MIFRAVFGLFLLLSYPAAAQTVVSFADAVQKVLPSVVSVSASKVQAEPPEMMLALRGSPFEQFSKTSIVTAGLTRRNPFCWGPV